MKEIENCTALFHISVEEIYEHPDNPRKDLGDLTELTESIRKNGIFQNLTVVTGHRLGRDEWIREAKAEGVCKISALGSYDPSEWRNDGYTVIIGHRRLAAAKAAGLKEVPCIIAKMTDQEMFRTMMIENMQRQDLTIIEQADGFQMMLDLGDTKEDITRQTGFSRTTIDRRLKLRGFDRKKLVKGFENGATIEDYLKLEKLDKKSDQDECLDKIGTSEFNQKYQSKLREQENAKSRKKAIEHVPWCKRLTKTEEAERWQKFDRMGESTADKPFKKPKDPEKYRFYENQYGNEITIYKQKEKRKTEKREQIEVDRDKWFDESLAKLRQMQQVHKELRDKFILTILHDQFMGKDVKEALIRWAGRLLIPGASSRYELRSYEADSKFLFESLGEEKPEDYPGEKSVPATNKVTNTKPWNALALAIYTALGRKEHFYTYKSGRSFTAETTTLKALYEFLEELGYAMSREEKDFVSGKIIEDLMRTKP